MKITVTGGAGFIGSHLTDLLVGKGHDVLVVDSLEKQVHLGKKPGYLNRKAKYIFEKAENPEAMKKYLPRTDILIHLAALVGVGQSMYQIKKYMAGNTQATAKILQYISENKHGLKKIVVASSMSIYGEGAYKCPQHGAVYPRLRDERDLARGDWEMKCPVCGKAVAAAPTNEDKPLYPTSIYAISKRDQEEMTHSVGSAYGIPTVALRFFNVYGERQALSNPYTGVLAIFASRLLNGNSPYIFEDAEQTRDFIYVKDLARGIYLAALKAEGNSSINLGCGRPVSVKRVAGALRDALAPAVKIEIARKFRKGDIRHCYADAALAEKVIGFKTGTSFEEGIGTYLEWLKHQKAADGFEKAARELKAKGLA